MINQTADVQQNHAKVTLSSLELHLCVLVHAAVSKFAVKLTGAHRTNA